MVSIAREPADAPGVRELLEASDAFHAQLYPPDENFLLDVSALQAPGVTVAVARTDGHAVGMGAIAEAGDGTAELKRFFVLPSQRGAGVAGRVLDEVLVVAAERGLHLLRLETGPLQPAAIAFYESRGFTRIPNFGEYVGSASSVCFGRSLVE